MSYILDALRRSEEERHQEQLKNLAGNDGLIHVPKQQSPVWPYLLIAALAVNAVIFMWMHFDKQTEAVVLPVSNIDKTTIAVSEANQSATPNAQTLKPVKSTESKEVGNLTASIATTSTAKEVSPRAIVAPPNDSTPPLNPVESSTYVDGGLLIQPKGQRRPIPEDLVYNEVRTEPRVTVSSVPIDTSPLVMDDSLRYRDVPRLIDLDNQFQRGIPSLTFNSHIYSDNPQARRVMINNIYLREGQLLSGMEVVMIGEVDIIFRKDGTLFKRAVMRDW